MTLLDLLIKSRSNTKTISETTDKQGNKKIITKTVETIEYYKINDEQIRDIIKEMVNNENN